MRILDFLHLHSFVIHLKFLHTTLKSKKIFRFSNKQICRSEFMERFAFIFPSFSPQGWNVCFYFPSFSSYQFKVEIWTQRWTFMSSTKMPAQRARQADFFLISRTLFWAILEVFGATFKRIMRDTYNEIQGISKIAPPPFGPRVKSMFVRWRTSNSKLICQVSRN